MQLKCNVAQMLLEHKVYMRLRWNIGTDTPCGALATTSIDQGLIRILDWLFRMSSLNCIANSTQTVHMYIVREVYVTLFSSARSCIHDDVLGQIRQAATHFFQILLRARTGQKKARIGQKQSKDRARTGQEQSKSGAKIEQDRARTKQTLPEAQRTQKLTPRLGLNLATTWRHLH